MDRQADTATTVTLAAHARRGLIKYSFRALGSAKHGAEILHRACEYKRGVAEPRNLPIWRPNSNNKKTREIGGPLHCRFSAKKQLYGQLRGAATHSHYEALDKHSMGGKDPICYLNGSVCRSVECCCCSSESQMAVDTS